MQGTFAEFTETEKSLEQRIDQSKKQRRQLLPRITAASGACQTAGGRDGGMSPKYTLEKMGVGAYLGNVLPAVMGLQLGGCP